MTDRSWGRDDFESLYAANPDPWNFATSPYEQRKYADTLTCLKGQTFCAALELGCSIGVMSRALAPLCDQLLAIDASPTALAIARERCKDLPQIRFAEGLLPVEWPEDIDTGIDIVLISEILYFMTRKDIETLAQRVTEACLPGALIVLVNWTGITDTPCTGDEAATYFIAACEARHARVIERRRRQHYRLDVLRSADLIGLE